MTNLDLLALYTKLCGFKLVVRANRTGGDIAIRTDPP